MQKIQFKSLFNYKVGILLVVALVAYTAVMTTMEFRKTTKVGYINTASLMEKYPAALKAREELNKKTEEWKKNLQTLETELTQLNQDLVQNAAKWKQDVLAQKQETMKKKQAEYAQYNRAISEKAAKTEAELFQPVYNDLNLKIADYGKHEGYDIILGTMSGGNILFAQDGVDLTQKFLDYTTGATTVASKN
ncbi:MAG: OmpH family outer membrane protein [Ignavibacteriae bacterium]|nr:OmpH family outer membrane protein [Ignavibacteriota bacterium]